MGLLDNLKAYIQANTTRSTRPVASPSDVINQGLLNPNQYNKVAADRFKDSAFGLLGIVPGVGDYASGVESADLFNRGENFAGTMAAIGALPMVPAFAGMVKRGGDVADALKPTKYELAHETARKNAVDMLGLPDNNTATDRARAMGFDTDAYHGTGGKDFTEFDITRSGDTTRSKNTAGTVFLGGKNTANNYIEPSYPDLVSAGVMPKDFDNLGSLFSHRAPEHLETLMNNQALQLAELETTIPNAISGERYIGGRFVKTKDIEDLRGEYGPLDFSIVDHMQEYSRISDAEILKAIRRKQKSLSKKHSIEVAAEIGGSPRILPLKVNTSGFNVKDFNGMKRVNGDFQKVIDENDIGSVLKNTYDGAGLDTVYAVKDPSRIRSRFAAFDPARANESDLLAGLAPYIGIGGLLSLGLLGQQEEQY